MRKLLFIYLLLLCASSQAQTIEEKFSQYHKTAYQEKLYVHTDKGFYLAGEIIWFKIYNVDGATHQPTDMSKIAYVEIIDNNNKPVMQGKIGLKKGKGNGSFYLPASVNSGNYRIRAYTRWMKNFSADHYFQKPVAIVNSLKPLALPAADTALRYRAAFFPEGGELVNDLESKVAFKITDAYGKGVDATGWIVSDKNDTAASFNTDKFGIGHFLFAPKAGQTYKAVIPALHLQQHLPAARQQGYAMQLTNGLLKVSTKGIDQQAVFLIVHNRQQITMAEKQTLTNGSAVFQIDSSKLADGVSYITLFNAVQQPVCERLYFKKPANILAITAASSAAQYGTRKRVGLTISTGNFPADLSLAVYRLNALQTADSSSILSHLWLQGELGAIESPEYYFSTADIAATDDMVLVHGWRRFNWDDILADKKPAFEYMPEYDGQVVSARLINPANETPIPNVGSFLSVPGTQVHFYNARSDQQGLVHFDVRDYYGQNEIILQTDGSVADYRIDVGNPFSEKYSLQVLSPWQISENDREAINEHSIGMQVLNAYTGEKLSQFTVPAIDTFPFYGRTARRYKLDDYTRFTTMEEVLREYVSEIGLRRNDGQFHMAIYNSDLKSFYPPDPLVLLDGVMINSQTLVDYDPLKLRVLDVVPNKYFHGKFTYNGIVSATTYHGDMPDLKLDPKSVILDYEGLQLQREFYAPVYKTEQQANNRLPDFRNLLYWNPNISTAQNGQTNLEFYTSDLKGSFVAVLQGIDDQGHAGSRVISFEVK